MRRPRTQKNLPPLRRPRLCAGPSVAPECAPPRARPLDEACLASSLARFKRPREYVFVERIPRSAAGKLLRRLLREGTYVAIGDYDSTL